MRLFIPFVTLCAAATAASITQEERQKRDSSIKDTSYIYLLYICSRKIQNMSYVCNLAIFLYAAYYFRVSLSVFLPLTVYPRKLCDFWASLTAFPSTLSDRFISPAETNGSQSARNIREISNIKFMMDRCLPRGTPIFRE